MKVDEIGRSGRERVHKHGLRNVRVLEIEPERRKHEHNGDDVVNSRCFRKIGHEYQADIVVGDVKSGDSVNDDAIPHIVYESRPHNVPYRVHGEKSQIGGLDQILLDVHLSAPFQRGIFGTGRF